jgi:sigma-54 specific flagellar transcriptional regulator A
MTKDEVLRCLALPSASMREALDLVSKVAPSSTTVFINGPSGSGKEFIARAVHLLSSRAKGPFVAVNCGAIPRELLESELFGSEKGAYTGSVKTRVGLLETAAGGTLFLDEIGDMPHDMQVKLLRVLEERAFTRVGGAAAIKADVRIVCATHRDLGSMVESQSFREDLYYRINVFPITLLPLDERKEDVPRLAELIVERFRAQGFAHCPVLTPFAIAAMQAASWPGNIRQLRNVIERAGVLYPDAPLGEREMERLLAPRKPIDRKVETIALMDVVRDLGDLFAPPPVAEPAQDGASAAVFALAAEPLAAPARLADPDDVELVRDHMRAADAFNLRDYLSALEASFIRAALAEAQNSVSAAARLLGLQRTTLIEKMKKLSIAREDA